MSRLLIDDHPVMIIPSLAVKLGVNEAVVLQQMHYWLVKSTHIKDKRKWVYNTYKDWHEQLPFWSERPLRRTITPMSVSPFFGSYVLFSWQDEDNYENHAFYQSINKLILVLCPF